MTSVSSYEAKTHLARLLRRVARGEQITITRHGVPVAMLVPPRESASPDDLAKAVRRLAQFRESHPLKGITIRELVQEGRRR